VAVLRFSIAALLAVGFFGCGAAVRPLGPEDKARRDVPIAICRKPLTPADLNESGAPRPEVYWKVLVPSFRGFGSPAEPSAPDCVGDPTRSATGSDPPLPVTGSDISVTPVGDGLEIVWLRTGAVSERVAAGPLAVVRPRPAEIDVYSIGLYQGSARHSRFELLRLGQAIAVMARDEGCADVKVATECESVASIYLPLGGALAVGAKTPTEHVQFGTMKEVGRVKYRLTTDPPTVEPAAIHVKEHLSVRDLSDDEVRRSDGERIFTLSGGVLTASQPSIWTQPAGKP
jgi:hypothetical protein